MNMYLYRFTPVDFGFQFTASMRAMLKSVGINVNGSGSFIANLPKDSDIDKYTESLMLLGMSQIDDRSSEVEAFSIHDALHLIRMCNFYREYAHTVDGDGSYLRFEPRVFAVVDDGHLLPCIIIKEDNNGTIFVVSTSPLDKAMGGLEASFTLPCD